MPKRFPKNPEVLDGWIWSSDNGIFMLREKFVFSEYLKYLEMLTKFPPGCKFVVVPDEVGDNNKTNEKFLQTADEVRQFGFPIAYCFQDGQNTFPDFDFDCAFVGGSNEYKMSQLVVGIIKEAKSREKWVHVGRVNCSTRIKHFYHAGADSVDGSGYGRKYAWQIRTIVANLAALHHPKLFELENEK